MSKKKTYLFQFPTAANAQHLLMQAEQYDVLAQHPVCNGKPDDTQVLIQGTGSVNFDLTMLATLTDTANEYHGVRLR